jgi:hypothetical protein
MPTNHRTQVFTPYVDKWLAHIRVLSEEIGPRGSTTEGERRGSEYCNDILRSLGLDSNLENFTSAKSIFQPHLFTSIAILAAFLIYPLAGRASALAAAIISALALVSDLLELSFINNPLRWIVSKGTSQNAVATLVPKEEHIQDLILIGHVDSQRTPLVFKSPRWVGVYKAFTTIAFVAFSLQVLLYFLGTFTLWRWIWPVSGLSALSAFLLAAMCIQADSTPFCHGANDNATAAGLVLTLTEHFKAEPLRNTRLWLVCTGCEEVQHYGAIDFFRRHMKDLVNPKSLVFEMLGCSGPAWLAKEGIIVPFHASPEMVRLAERVSDEHPELNAYATSISGGNTEMADALRNGIPAITLFGLTPSGEAPFWHMVGDTFDKIDPAVLAKNYEFAWYFIQAIDQTTSGLKI